MDSTDTAGGRSADGKPAGNNLLELPRSEAEGVKALIEQLITWAPGTKNKQDGPMALWGQFRRLRAECDGGLGSFWGVVLAALLVGVVRGITIHFAAAYGEASMYILMFLVLLLRPRGLLGERIEKFE